MCNLYGSILCNQMENKMFLFFVICIIAQYVYFLLLFLFQTKQNKTNAHMWIEVGWKFLSLRSLTINCSWLLDWDLKSLSALNTNPLTLPSGLCGWILLGDGVN